MRGFFLLRAVSFLDCELVRSLSSCDNTKGMEKIRRIISELRIIQYSPQEKSYLLSWKQSGILIVIS